jgi:hypothetical protein
LRNVGSAKHRRRADRRHQVGHQRQVQHLLHRDPAQRLAPPGVCHLVLTQQRRLGFWNQDVR